MGPAKSALNATTGLSIGLQEAYRTGKILTIVFEDKEKFFNRVTHNIQLSNMEHQGKTPHGNYNNKE